MAIPKKHKCRNCGKQFVLGVPDRTGPEAATDGVYSTDSPNFVFYAHKNSCHPYCPHCGYVNMDLVMREEQ